MEMTPELMESFAAAMGGALAQGMAKHDEEKRERDEEREPRPRELRPATSDRMKPATART